MGFQVPRKTARLKFEGSEFDGCEIVVGLDLSLGASDHMTELQASEDSKKMVSFFAENCIVSWNLEGADGKALPIESSSLLGLPAWFTLLILNGWTAAVKEASEVTAPLDEPSKNGSGSEEASVMTEAPSSVPESLPTPSS